MPLGLHDVACAQAAKLRKGAVGRAENAVAQGAGIGLQRPGEEVVERGVGGRVRFQCLAHVHVEAFDERLDDGVLDPWLIARGDLARQPGKRVMGQWVLQ